MQEALDEFTAALEACGYSLRGRPVVADDAWHRCFFGDERASSGRYRLLVQDDGFAIGGFGSDKDAGGFRSWHSKSSRKITGEERAANARRAEEFARQKAQREKKRHERLAARIERAFKSCPRTDSHPYLARKKLAQGHRARLRRKGGELLVPLVDTAGRIWNIQRITARGAKFFFRGARVSGLCFPLGSVDAAQAGQVILIAEGYATGASLHEATGLPVRVAFNAGNLKHVALALRKKYPQAALVFCADNDAWTFRAGKAPEGVEAAKVAADDPRWAEWREAGLCYNTGIEKAKDAAAAIGGALVLWPETAAADGKLTDFNDIAERYGLGVVEQQVRGKIRRAIEAAEAARANAAISHSGNHGQSGDALAAPMEAGEEKLGERVYEPAPGPFQVLGYNNGRFYFFPRNSHQIVSQGASGLANLANLFTLAPLEYWHDHFNADGKQSSRKIGELAANALIYQAHERGVFIEEDRVRGAGAWIDEGRIVLHAGDRLYVDGERVEFENFRSEFIYVASARLIRPARDALENHESYRLRRICEAVTWENPLSGTLLAGWLVIAPICAALTYRPHIYLTGESDSGKSTVLDRIIKPVLGRMALCVDGGTTEPSVRERMGYDGRPLVYDEAEPSPSMPEVIRLARKASTGSTITKFGQRPFKARFAACFAAINPPVKDVADENRISFMVTKKNRKPTAMQDYDALLATIEEVITPDFSERLIARTLQNINSLVANIRIFTRAVRIATGAARASQQIGTMLAGVYLLHRTDVITEQAALEWVGKYDWGEHALLADEGDPIRLVQHLAGSLVRWSVTGGEISIGELIDMAHHKNDADADRLLRYYGIAVRDGMVDVASRSQNLARLLRDTDWQDKWSRALGDVPGAQKRPSAYFSRGVRTSATSLPVGLFTDSDVARDMQQQTMGYYDERF